MNSLFNIARCVIRREHSVSALRSCHRKVVPEKPTWQPFCLEDVPQDSKINENLVKHLERLALVDFGDQEGVDRLAAAVQFADQLCSIPTDGVEPLITVIEDWPLYLRKDEVTEGNRQQEITSHAQRTEEDYFVAPPGNIPLSQAKDYKGNERKPSNNLENPS